MYAGNSWRLGEQQRGNARITEVGIVCDERIRRTALDMILRQNDRRGLRFPQLMQVPFVRKEADIARDGLIEGRESADLRVAVAL
jgi:hypothetical protein